MDASIRKKKRLRRAVRFLCALAALLLLASVFPYFFPVTEAPDEMPAPFPESRTAEIGGVLLHYRLWLPDAGAARGKLLLVHGFGASTFSWQNSAAAMAGEGFAVLAADLPGFGYSDRRRGIDHSQENRASLLWRFLDRADADLAAASDGSLRDFAEDPWDLAGHSMGGGTVTAMALADPDRTRSVILADGAVLTSVTPLRFLMRYPPAGRWIEVLCRHLFFQKERVASFLAYAYGSAPSAAALDGYLKPLLLDGTEGALADMMRTSTRIRADALKGLSSPVFAIWGGKDTVVPIAEAYQLQSLIPSMQLRVIPDAGHCPMETHSDLFDRYLLEALGETPES